MPIHGTGAPHRVVADPDGCVASEKHERGAGSPRAPLHGRFVLRGYFLSPFRSAISFSSLSSSGLFFASSASSSPFFPVK
jgi:hypothetical protein